jgi:Tfp pilus assembly protein PilV
LIEVVVAFAIFALSLAALYESFGGALRRSAQAENRERGLLVAQSLLSSLRASAAPWKAEDSGTLENGGWWRIDVAPFDASASERSQWRAFAVTVQVGSDPAVPRPVTLRSVELARVPP